MTSPSASNEEYAHPSKTKTMRKTTKMKMKPQTQKWYTPSKITGTKKGPSPPLKDFGIKP
jgi:hypothetical protein